MKKIFFASAVLAILATGCTKGPDSTPMADLIANGSGWANFNLNLVESASDLTKSNDVFDDGRENEYVVENACLVLFAGEVGESEDKATLRSAYALNPGDWNKSTNSQITVSRNTVTRIYSSNLKSDEWLYAFVILNAPSVFSIESEKVNNVNIPTLAYNGASIMGMNFGDFKKIPLEVEDDLNLGGKAFVMTNMPYVTATGSALDSYNESAKTLYRFDASKVSKTEAEAVGKEPGVSICVERVLAKVTVNLSETARELVDDPTIRFDMLGWALDNTNPQTYITRNLPATPDYIKYRANSTAPRRMVAKDCVKNDVWGSPIYRTYWGVDMNYNLSDERVYLNTKAGTRLNPSLMEFNAAHANIGGDLRDNGSSYYCTENTFDVAHQTIKNSTRILVAAKFNNGNDFYTLSTEPNTILLKEITPDKASIQTKAIDLLANRVSVGNWVSGWLPEGSNLHEFLTINVSNDQVKLGNASLSVSLNTAALEYISDETKRENAILAWNAICDDQNQYLKELSNQVNYYKDGVAYYHSPISHFDNAETPWEGRADMSNTTESVYDNNNEQKYLGRYGVLRNNWYAITVKSLAQIGSPVVPDVSSDPDDMVCQYFRTISDLAPWEKREKEVGL